MDRFFLLSMRLLKEGFLDEQFTQLQRLQDESEPDFVRKAMCMFFQDAERICNEFWKTMQHQQQPLDFKKIHFHAHSLKGASASVGARRVKIACSNVCNACDAQDLEECRRCFEVLTQEYRMLQDKILFLFKMENDIRQSGGSIPAAWFSC